MLQGLGRWLRAAGYDTLIASKGAPDRELLSLAHKEQRLFLTRDRLLSENKAFSEIVVVLQANDLPGCIEELSGLFELDWLKAPFSRCLLCNQPLVMIADEQHLLTQDLVPDDVCSSGQAVLYCSACRKAYWEGSHVRRMRARLEAFNQGEWQ